MPERATIPLGDNHVAYVDAADLERVSAYRWRYKIDGNTVRAVRDMRWLGMWCAQRLECFILGLNAPTQPVRFVDGNPLHCWRDNMEALDGATRSTVGATTWRHWMATRSTVGATTWRHYDGQGDIVCRIRPGVGYGGRIPKRTSSLHPSWRVLHAHAVEK
jgi:hypothetical protein